MSGVGEVAGLQAAAFDAMAIGAALIDAQGVVVSVNAAWRPLARDVRGAPHREAFAGILDEADARELSGVIDGLLRGTRQAHRAELRACGNAGNRWFEVRLARVAGPGVLATLEDVTDRRRQREAAWDAEGLRESEATLRAILDAVPDVVFRMRADGSLVEPSDEVVRSTRGPRTLQATIAEQSAFYAERALATRTPKGGLCRLTNRGQARDYETRIVPYSADVALVIARDITDQTRTEEELQLLLGITLATGEVADLSKALTVVLRLVCESTGWIAGAAWTPAEGKAFRCDAFWLARDTAELRSFRDACVVRTTLPREGLAGRVAADGRATWVADVTRIDDEPSHRAGAAGFRTGFAVPVLAGAETVAVLEFYAFEARDEDERLLTMVSAVAEQLGALMKRKRVEESVRLLESALEQLSEPIVISTTSSNGATPRIVYVSPAFTRMTGYAANEAVGRGLDMLTGPNTDRGLTGRVSSEASEGHLVEFETINYRKDGSELPVEWRVAPARADDGSVSHIIAIQRDITQRRQVEAARGELQRALETAARQWRITFDAIESPIFLLDKDAYVVRVNRAAKALGNVDYKEQIGRPLTSIGEGEPWKEGASIARLAFERRAPASGQVRDEARKQTWDFAATLIDDDDGEKIILVARDITRLVELQESLRRSETMSVMGSLVAGVAHEVRNPLHAITVTLDAFENRFRVPEHAGHISVLRGEVARLTTLMRDLLEYGKPQTVRPYPGHLTEIVTQSISVCAREAQEKDVTIVSEVDPDLPSVFMDPERLLQVVNNVLQNAIQHSKSKGKVTISGHVAQEDGVRWVECSVTDEGPGFREADLPRVFEPFFTRRKGGTGLGLSIVQRIVDVHRGRVWASNRAKGSDGTGGGAVITVRLPVPEAYAYDSRRER